MADYSFIPQVVATFLNQQRNRAQQMQLEELARRFEERENEKRRQLLLLQTGLAAKQAQEQLKRGWAETFARMAEAEPTRRLTELEIAAEKKRQKDEAKKELVLRQLGELIKGGAHPRTIMGAALAGGLTPPSGLTYKTPEEEDQEATLAAKKARREKELFELDKKRINANLAAAELARKQGKLALHEEKRKQLAFDQMMSDWHEWGWADRAKFLQHYPEELQREYARMVWVSEETGSMPRTEAEDILSTFDALDEHKAKGDLKDILNGISKGKNLDRRIDPRLIFLWKYSEKYPEVREELLNTARRTQGLPEIEGIEPVEETGGATATPSRLQVIKDAREWGLTKDQINRILKYLGYE